MTKKLIFNMLTLFALLGAPILQVSFASDSNSSTPDTRAKIKAPTGILETNQKFKGAVTTMDWALDNAGTGTAIALFLGCAWFFFRGQVGAAMMAFFGAFIAAAAQFIVATFKG